MAYELIDTHAHLDFPEFDSGRDAVIESALAQGVTRIINIGASLERSQRSVELAAHYECIYATVGIHPHEADTFSPAQADELRRLARSPKVVGIGEIGLDYFKNYSRHDRQRDLFAALLYVAKETELPLVIHTRSAGDDTLAILRNFMPLNAVIHCFSGDNAFLKACLELGFLVSFTCNITYLKAELLREAVKAAPLDRIMLETDAPFLPPEGMRGKRNDPGNVALLAEEIARLKGLSPEDVARATTANAKHFFNLP